MQTRTQHRICSADIVYIVYIEPWLACDEFGNSMLSAALEMLPFKETKFTLRHIYDIRGTSEHM